MKVLRHVFLLLEDTLLLQFCLVFCQYEKGLVFFLSLSYSRDSLLELQTLIPKEQQVYLLKCCIEYLLESLYFLMQQVSYFLFFFILERPTGKRKKNEIFFTGAVFCRYVKAHHFKRESAFYAKYYVIQIHERIAESIPNRFSFTWKFCMIHVRTHIFLQFSYQSYLLKSFPKDEEPFYLAHVHFYLCTILNEKYVLGQTRCRSMFAFYLLKLLLQPQISLAVLTS